MTHSAIGSCVKNGCAEQDCREAYRHRTAANQNLRRLGQTRTADATEAAGKITDDLDQGFTIASLSKIYNVPASTLSKVYHGKQLRINREDLARIMNASVKRRKRPWQICFGARRRLQSLCAAGYSAAELAAALTARGHKTSRIWVSQMIDGTYETTNPKRAQAVARLFRELEAKPFPQTPHAKQVRNWAKSRGFHPPLAWDHEDLDDPLALPHS